ncbi:MAG TPA: hypothetical protein PKC85_00780 [Bacteroidia bacterium]|nr:hypothetical protein [Bacteroidia bacterium]HMU18352.1 hypothetical protein [Bacteroidia bacterium]
MKNAILIVLIYSLASCKSAKQEFGNQNLETVTVTDMRNLDGCGYLLKTADQKMLIPDNLDTSFQKNNLKLEISYKKTQVMTTCMAGQTITLIYCKKAK